MRQSPMVYICTEEKQMIIEKRIKDFEKLGFGMFVHFGIYSALGKGEWAMKLCDIPKEEYVSLKDSFKPRKDWAEKLVATAKLGGCKYITLTTRHHDGFSLYDTKGLNDFDAPHSIDGRDLVAEFVEACNKEGIIPFFYHTLLDWSREDYNSDFKAYLKYLRESIELLCKNYGRIGGFWFDGMWDKREADWEEDLLYSLIRSYQPDAMIINNTGIDARGNLGHIELDSVTFERGKPKNINSDDADKYIASEMCQVFGTHWGYAKNDFLYKSLAEIIEDLCVCRRYGANYLLNVGPMGDGSLRPIDKAMFTTLGEWIKIQEEAIYLPRPCGVDFGEDSKDFVLKNGKSYYLFCHNLVIEGDCMVVLREDEKKKTYTFEIDGNVKSAVWLDDGSEVEFEQQSNKINVKPKNYMFGNNLVIRIAKIETE